MFRNRSHELRNLYHANGRILRNSPLWFHTSIFLVRRANPSFLDIQDCGNEVGKLSQVSKNDVVLRTINPLTCWCIVESQKKDAICLSHNQKTCS